MRATNSLARWGLAACLVGSVGLLQAQDTGFGADFKLRLAYAYDTHDSLRHNYQGFGCNVNYGLGVGKVGLEIGYMYKTGDPYTTLPDSSRIPEGYASVDTSNSVEDKRNELSGLTGRLSWSQTLNETWDWQAGLQIGPKFKHQYVADARSTENGTTWRDLYNGVPRESGFKSISPYAGFTWKVDADSALEMNVVFLRYTSIDYHHYAGTGSYYRGGDQAGLNDPTVPFPYDKLEKHDRMDMHFEIAYVFHF